MMNARKRLYSVIAWAVLSLTIVGTSVAQAADDSQSLKDRLNASSVFLEKLLADPRWEGVGNLFGAAKAIVIVPNTEKAALVVGYETGQGVMLRRHGETWSDPIAIWISSKSIAFQAGVQSGDLVMAILTDTATEELLEGLYKVSGSGGFALGNFGVSGQAGGGVSGGIETLSVSLNKGAFLGGGLAGLNLGLDPEVNERTYGKVPAREVLGKSGGMVEDASGLRKILERAVHKSWWE